VILSKGRRHGWRRGRGLLLSFVLLAACGGSAPAPATSQDQLTSQVEIKVGTTLNVLQASLPVIAERFGFFSKEKLKATFVNVTSGTAEAQLVGSGQLDFGVGVLPTLIQGLRAQGANASLVAGLVDRQPGALICQKTLPTTGVYPEVIKSLEGHSIGVTMQGSGSWQTIRFTVIASGADLDKVKVVTLGNEGTDVASLKAKQIDCAFVTQPNYTRLAGDFKTVVDYQKGPQPKEMQNYVATPIAAGNTVLGNRAVVRAFARAIKAAALFAGDPKNAKDIATKLLDWYQGITLDELTQIYSQVAPIWSYKLTEAMFANSDTIASKVSGQSTKYPQSEYVSKDVLDIVGR
jgi:ABC-type nitrate/sulfonate/bicarbonate transport system substrate-binding protein